MDITLLLQWLLIVLFAAVIAFITVKTASAVKELNLDTGSRWFLDQLVETAVNAAEQKFFDKPGSGKSKFDYAMEWLDKACNKYGIDFDETFISPLVEAKVKELFNTAEAIFD